MPERNASTREKRAGPTRPPKEQRAKIDTKEEKDSITAASASASMTQDQTHDIDMSDDESVDLSAQDHGSPAESVKSGGDDAIKPESEGGTTQGDSEAAGPNMPVQKRRRVTRACDECRRKKIKCDGKQPCTHCSVYSYECTYDKPSNRRRNPAPQYIEALEARLQRAETLLRKFIPDVDLTDPDLDPAVQQEFRTREQARAKAARLKAEEELSIGAATSSTNQDQQYHQHAGSEDPQIMSMIETIGQLELNEGGEWDFHGISSGAVFLKRMKEHFSGILGNDYRIPFLPRPSKSAGMFTLDSPRSSAAGSPWDASGASSSVSTPNIYDLPPQEKVRALCYYALHCATCLLRLVHIPTFYETLGRLYEKPQESWGHEEHRFLGLLYSVMALGCMYNVSEDDPSGPPISYKSSLEEATKYYTSARMILQDVAECRDMTSLQGLLFMILFLQATSNMSGCYAFLGIALRSSLRMGLHRHLSHAKINPIEDETRRRVFHCVRQMDTYVSAILGFPLLLRDEDIDQPLPTEVDDEYITKDAILMPPPGTPSFLTGTNAHSKLMDILAKVIKHIYPLKGVEQCVVNQRGFGGSGDANATYMISYARIKEIERDLAEWYEQLPIYWRPSSEGPMEVIRVRTLLRFGYAHVQMMLYRPFLHYVSPRLTAGKKIDDRYYNCAAAGISVSRNIIHIAIEIQKQAVLIGPYWFIIYAEFFAILSLVFYVLENPDKAGAAEILADAQAGKEVIAKLAQRSLSADRITSALNVVFDQIPERLKKLAARPATSRKRPAAAAVIPGTTTKAATTGSVPLQAGAHSAVRDPTIGIGGRRSEELIRPHHFQTGGGGRRGEVKRPPQRTTSFDTVNVAMQNGLPGQQGGNYATNLQDLLPLDMTLRGTPTAAESDPSSAGGSQHPRQAGSYTPQSSVTSLYKLDAMMFPSSDPFAYPNQPLLESQGPVVRGNSHPPGATAGTAGNQTPEAAAAMQFYMPNVYDDIEGQLLGPIPPYLVSQAGPHHPQGQMQHHGQQHHRMDRMDPASQMYTHPGSHAHILRLQQQQQGQQGGQGQGQGQQEGGQGQQQRQLMEQILGGDPAFRGDWDVLGGGFH